MIAANNVNNLEDGIKSYAIASLLYMCEAFTRHCFNEKSLTKKPGTVEFCYKTGNESLHTKNTKCSAIIPCRIGSVVCEKRDRLVLHTGCFEVHVLEGTFHVSLFLVTFDHVTSGWSEDLLLKTK